RLCRPTSLSCRERYSPVRQYNSAIRRNTYRLWKSSAKRFCKSYARADHLTGRLPARRPSQQRVSDLPSDPPSAPGHVSPAIREGTEMTIVSLVTIHPNPGVSWDEVQKQLKIANDLARKHGAENVTTLVTMIGGDATNTIGVLSTAEDWAKF